MPTRTLQTRRPHIGTGCRRAHHLRSASYARGPKFPDYHVDIECNRKDIGVEPKDLKLPDENGNLTAKKVFPDIIVHERGNSRRNALVVEVKKLSSSFGDEHDYAKLQAMCWQLRYQNGLFLRLSTGTSGHTSPNSASSRRRGRARTRQAARTGWGQHHANRRLGAIAYGT